MQIYNTFRQNHLIDECNNLVKYHMEIPLSFLSILLYNLTRFVNFEIDLKLVSLPLNKNKSRG